MKYMAEFNANFRHYCIDIAGDTLSGSESALKAVNNATHTPTYEQRPMQVIRSCRAAASTSPSPSASRSCVEEVRENADRTPTVGSRRCAAVCCAVLCQTTTSVDGEGRTAVVHEHDAYLTQEQVDRLIEQAVKQGTKKASKQGTKKASKQGTKKATSKQLGEQMEDGRGDRALPP